MDHYRFLIDGQLVDSASGERFTTVDPASGQPLATVAAAGRADVDAAVKAARKAFTSWSLTTPSERADIVMDLADRMQSAIVRLGVLESNDSGGLVSRTSTDRSSASTCSIAGSPPGVPPVKNAPPGSTTRRAGACNAHATPPATRTPIATTRARRTRR